MSALRFLAHSSFVALLDTTNSAVKDLTARAKGRSTLLGSVSNGGSGIAVVTQGFASFLQLNWDPAAKDASASPENT